MEIKLWTVKGMMLVSLVMLLICGIMFTVSYFSRKSAQNFIDNGVLTDAKIISIEKVETSSSWDEDTKYEHIVMVEYLVEGKPYISKLDQYSFTMNVGDTIAIRYLKDDPSKVKIATNDFLLPNVFLGIGCLFAVLLLLSLGGVVILKLKD